VSVLPDVEPIIPTLVAPLYRYGWVFAEKYDGWRMVARKDAASRHQP
jgi:ATP-dependent DNA ligase